jgi:molybdopterin molybdotransferase
MLSFKEAQQIIISQAHSFGKERINLNDAYNRVLAEQIKADRDYPPFDRSVMDGFAINKSDWDEGIREFSVVETIYAGKISKQIISKGECYKIMTGASVPPAVNIVIRREDVDEEMNKISVHPIELQPFQNIAKQGKDIKQASIVSDKNIRCTTPVIGLLASLGKSKFLVECLPKVSVITTGDEVVDIEDAINPVQIRNANVYAIKALLKQWNIDPIHIEHVPDDIEKLRSAITIAKDADIIIVSGGVSAGDADHVPGVLEKLGAEKIFHKVAIKPGKPLWFGKFSNGTIVFALPGNPLSCMVTFKLFIDLFLSCSFGLGEPNVLSLPFNGTRKKISSLDEFFPVKISGNPSVLELLSFNNSGDITAAIHADGVALHPKDMLEISAGAVLDFYKLS